MSARRFAWSLVAVSALLAIPTAVLMIVQIGGFTPGDTFVQGGAGGPAFVIASLAYVIVGAFVVSRGRRRRAAARCHAGTRLLVHGITTPPAT